MRIRASVSSSFISCPAASRISSEKAAKRATTVSVALPMANPLPIAAVVFPTESSSSVMARTSLPRAAISAIPPALSEIGPNASIANCIAVVAIIAEAAKATNGLIYVVEDCYYEGNLGETVAYALKSEKTKMYHRAVDRVPRSGTATELYDMFGLSSDKIYLEIKDILSKN